MSGFSRNKVFIMQQETIFETKTLFSIYPILFKSFHTIYLFSESICSQAENCREEKIPNENHFENQSEFRMTKKCNSLNVTYFYICVAWRRDQNWYSCVAWRRDQNLYNCVTWRRDQNLYNCVPWRRDQNKFFFQGG